MSSNRNLDIALQVAEQQNARALTSRFSSRMKANAQDFGPGESMRYTILTYVASEAYERAIEELGKYLNSKGDYPEFRERAERFVSYAIDLINAIKAKRSFPGLHLLAAGKQQELCDRAMEHFEDLKHTLRKVEHIEREIRLSDVRSTILVVKAIAYSAFALLVMAFLSELSRGVLPSAMIVIDSTFGDLVNWVFDQVGI